MANKSESTEDAVFDIIIVGGGTAGMTFKTLCGVKAESTCFKQAVP